MTDYGEEFRAAIDAIDRSSDAGRCGVSRDYVDPTIRAFDRLVSREGHRILKSLGIEWPIVTER